MVYKPLRVAFAPLILRTLKPAAFVFQGRTLETFYHPYNMTWATERMVEVPIIREYLRKAAGANILEIGNVLSHYGPVSHVVLDKFERGPGVINEDILNYNPGCKYDLIVSISTFEHIGYDDESEIPSAQKIQEALHCSRGLLGIQGRLVISVPIAYNPDLDALIRDENLGMAAETYLRRVASRDWRACSKEEALRCRFGKPFPYGNALLVAEFSPVRQG